MQYTFISGKTIKLPHSNKYKNSQVQKVDI